MREETGRFAVPSDIPAEDGFLMPSEPIGYVSSRIKKPLPPPRSFMNNPNTHATMSMIKMLLTLVACLAAPPLTANARQVLLEAE